MIRFLIKAIDGIHAFLLFKHGIYFQLPLLKHFDSARICLELSYLAFEAAPKLFQIYVEIQASRACSSLSESLKMNIYLPRAPCLYRIMTAVHLIEFQGLNITLSSWSIAQFKHYRNKKLHQHLNLNYESKPHIPKYAQNILILVYAYLNQVWWTFLEVNIIFSQVLNFLY